MRKPIKLNLTRLALLGTLFLGTSAQAAPTAAELAAGLNKAIEDGDSSARLRLTVKPPKGSEKTVLQLRIKARRSAEQSEIVYQVLFPKARKGEAFLLKRKRSGSPAGHHFRPPDTMTPLDKARMNHSLLGSDLTYQDVIENFFRWETQSLTGKETIGRVECLILESKPGANDTTSYGSVRSWVDPRKMVVMRVEKYDRGGKRVLRIDTEKVAKDDNGRHTPMHLTARRTGSNTATEIEGSNIRHDIRLTTRDFTVPTFTDLKIPRSR